MGSRFSEKLTVIRYRIKYALSYYIFEQWKRIGKKPDVYFYNWWNSNREIQWFYRFIKARHIPLERSLNFFSVFGRKAVVSAYSVEGVKIFYTGEDVHKNAFGSYSEYQDYCLDSVDFALGFDKQTNKQTIYVFQCGYLIL
ncbi:hypothetical protein B0188_01710 [[Haemophilus] felis]|uniref:Alpha-(1,3)-fucosyltransferase FucT N-terminal domain-containing protein n=1 Tax=[Haemophilus] felis TaxID=123822 RepID=A0A1T0BA20_9PAST|nr:hypothetical protein B0188_01710 [[Haemophilus] felis]